MFLLQAELPHLKLPSVLLVLLMLRNESPSQAHHTKIS